MDTRKLVAEWIIRTARGAAWAPILVFLLHLVLSRLVGAHVAFSPLDLPMHLLGGVAITYFAAYAAGTALGLGLLGRPTRALLVFVVFTAACSAAMFWEFAEFCSDYLLGTHAQVDLEDTLSDMFFGVVGSIVYLSAVRFRVIARDVGSWTAADS